MNGNNSTSAEKAYLVLNVYETSNKPLVHEQLLNASQVLSLKITDKPLSQKLINSIVDGVSSEVTLENYKLSVKKRIWPSGSGYEVHFAIGASK